MILGIRNWVLLLVAAVALVAVSSTCWSADPPVSQLVASAKTGDEAARLKAIDMLGGMGPAAAEAVPTLGQLLTDRSANVKAHAVWALGRIGAASKPAVPAISELLKDPDQAIRRQAIAALESIRPGPDVMVPLVIRMLEDADEGVRMRILHSVTNAGASAVPGLIQALGTEKGAYWACIVLRDMGPVGKDAIPALIERLKDKRPEIRREAALALGAMGEAATSALPAIASGLDDEHTRTAATFVLGEIGKLPPGAEAKIQANVKSNDKMLAAVSSWAISRAHPTNKELIRVAATNLIEMIQDKDPFVRTAAARAIVSLPPAPEITLPLWEKTLASADETTVHHALDALASLGPAAVPRLVDILKRKQLRLQVVYILGQIGPPSAPAAELLAEMVDDPDSRLATESVLALAQIGPGAKAAVPRLAAALAQRDRPNAHGIVYALGKIGPDAAVAEPKLTELMGDKDDRLLAVASAWALTQVKPKNQAAADKALPVLVAALKDPLVETRHAAAEAIGVLGPMAKSAAPALEAATKDEAKEVRDAATESLKHVK